MLIDLFFNALLFLMIGGAMVLLGYYLGVSSVLKNDGATEDDRREDEEDELYPGRKD